MMVPISEQVFVPVSHIRRISFFADYALVKYVDHSDEKVEGEDATRLRDFLLTRWGL